MYHTVVSPDGCVVALTVYRSAATIMLLAAVDTAALLRRFQAAEVDTGEERIVSEPGVRRRPSSRQFIQQFRTVSSGTGATYPWY